MTKMTTRTRDLHNTYGGEITEFDFEGQPNMITVASQIRRSTAFDKQCRMDCAARDRRYRTKMEEVVNA